MSDEKQNKWFITLDELLNYPPEEVFELFVHDFRNVFGVIGSASEVLSKKEINVETHDKLIKMIQESTSKAYEGLDLMLAYLKARNEPKDASE